MLGPESASKELWTPCVVKITEQIRFRCAAIGRIVDIKDFWAQIPVSWTPGGGSAGRDPRKCWSFTFEALLGADVPLRARHVRGPVRACCT